MAILSGMAIGGVVMTSLRSVIAIGVGFGILGVRVEPFNIFHLLGVFAVTMVALYALGMTFASLFLLWGREAWHICNALQEPVYFLSGMYFPLRTLGALGLVAAGLIPLALGIDAMRQVLLGPNAHGLMRLDHEVWALVAAAVTFLALAHVSLAYLEKLSKREGRLTQRWQ
jgi:ABC-2 type transport system permease protein